MQIVQSDVWWWRPNKKTERMPEEDVIRFSASESMQIKS